MLHPSLDGSCHTYCRHCYATDTLRKQRGAVCAWMVPCGRWFWPVTVLARGVSGARVWIVYGVLGSYACVLSVGVLCAVSCAVLCWRFEDKWNPARRACACIGFGMEPTVEALRVKSVLVGTRGITVLIRCSPCERGWCIVWSLVRTRREWFGAHSALFDCGGGAGAVQCRYHF
jgi:hypothetical protein